MVGPPADLCRKAKEAVMTDNPAVPEIPVLRDNRGLFYGWFVVAAAFAVTFVGFGCTYSFSAFIESLQRDFGASRGSVSLVFALAGFLYFSVGSISGPLADRFGSRRLALIGMILIGAGLVAASVAQSLLQVYAAYGLGIGLGVGCSYVPAVGAVPRWFARRRGLASGIASSGIGFGTLIVPPLASLLIKDVGWRGFLARPTDLSAIADRTFYIAGGYKYAMAGEGACFMHCPPGIAARPRNTGWFASFRTLSTADHGVPFPADGWRFAGATFDPTALYRLSAVLEWLAAESIDAALVHAHAVALQTQFMAAMADHTVGPFVPERLVVPLSEPARGNFLTFEHPEAVQWYQRLHATRIVTDVRGTRLRLGFGLYHTSSDVERLVSRLRNLA
jgi:MFS family permease